MTETAAAHTDSAAEKASGTSAARSVVVPTLGLWHQAERIGGGLTPAIIASIIRDGDSGNIRRLIDLANECRQQDAHLQAVLGTHEESIAGLSYQIVAPTLQGREKPRDRDKRAALWCEEQLRGNPAIHRLIADLAGAYYYSFSVVEIVWRKDGARLVPDRFIHVAPRRFKFRQVDGLLVLADPNAAEVDLPGTYKNKFIISRPRVNGDVAHREGLMRPLVWMSCMRRWDIGDWMSTAEMSWKPWRIATYKQGSAGKQDREELETVIRRMTADFTAVIPDSTSINVTWPAGSNSGRSTHAELANVLAQEMSKAVLGQTETTQASASSGYAQAKVHDAVRRDLRESRARQIAADITRDLLGPMVRLNFGTGVQIPRFEFVTQDPVDLASFGKALKDMYEAGVTITQAWAHEQAGIPEPKKGEAVLGQVEAPNATDGKPKPDNGSEDVYDDGSGSGAPDGKEPPPDEKPEAEDE
jgi:phage gp29-like protein